MPYKDCKIYGPYSGKDGRLRIISINRITGKRQTVSYPKYLIELNIGRYLKENETIDHIDGNFLNNELSNLQILDRREHAILDIIRNDNIKVKCIICGKEFIVKGNRHKDSNSRGSGYFCSKRCCGIYGSRISQHKQNKIEGVERIEPEKFKIKSQSL